jgi:hypothetical protein
VRCLLGEHRAPAKSAGPADYVTDVLARNGVQFSDSSTAAGRPFFLELATFSLHAPYVPAPRNIGDFPVLEAPRPANFRPAVARRSIAPRRRGRR